MKLTRASLVCVWVLSGIVGCGSEHEPGEIVSAYDDGRCNGVPDFTNKGCGTGTTDNGGSKSGIVQCRGGKPYVMVCGPVADCSIGDDGQPFCKAWPCDPATTKPYCTSDNNYVSCDKDEKRYSVSGCGSRNRCDPQQGCVDVRGQPCNPATFPPFCGNGNGGDTVTECDPVTGTVVVVNCNNGSACSVALGPPADCLTPPPPGTKVQPWVDLNLCIDSGHIGTLTPNGNPPTSGTWKVSACPAGTECSWKDSGQAWCRPTDLVDTRVVSATETDTETATVTVTSE